MKQGIGKNESPVRSRSCSGDNLLKPKFQVAQNKRLEVLPEVATWWEEKKTLIRGFSEPPH